MDRLTQVIGTLGFFAACLAGMACVIVATINMFRALANRRDGAPLTSSDRSLFSVLFWPAQFTQHGLDARRWVIYGFIGFWVFAALAVTIGVLTGVAR